MPTIGIYIPMRTARVLAASLSLDVNSDDFVEAIRAIAHEAIADEAGVRLPLQHDPDCAWAHMHRTGRPCRHCGGT